MALEAASHPCLTGSMGTLVFLLENASGFCQKAERSSRELGIPSGSPPRMAGSRSLGYPSLLIAASQRVPMSRKLEAGTLRWDVGIPHSILSTPDKSSSLALGDDEIRELLGQCGH